ncbi:hypothetical protein RIVM261_062880 [Rivularia sp. IAM M-261]|nr:hypothetical protein RIVM261_062880 [Rivularia sp. IAM M-261]
MHFISGGGRYLGSIDNRQGSIQRRIRGEIKHLYIICYDIREQKRWRKAYN